MLLPESYRIVYESDVTPDESNIRVHVVGFETEYVDRPNVTGHYIVTHDLDTGHVLHGHVHYDTSP